MPSKKGKKKATRKSSSKKTKDLSPRKDPKGGAVGDTLTLNLKGKDSVRPRGFRR